MQVVISRKRVEGKRQIRKKEKCMENKKNKKTHRRKSRSTNNRREGKLKQTYKNKK